MDLPTRVGHLRLLMMVEDDHEFCEDFGRDPQVEYPGVTDRQSRDSLRSSSFSRNPVLIHSIFGHEYMDRVLDHNTPFLTCILIVK